MPKQREIVHLSDAFKAQTNLDPPASFHVWLTGQERRRGRPVNAYLGMKLCESRNDGLSYLIFSLPIAVAAKNDDVYVVVSCVKEAAADLCRWGTCLTVCIPVGGDGYQYLAQVPRRREQRYHSAMLKNKKYRTKKKKMYPLIDIFSLSLLLSIPYFFYFCCRCPRRPNQRANPTSQARGDNQERDGRPGPKTPQLRLIAPIFSNSRQSFPQATHSPSRTDIRCLAAPGR